MISTIVNTDMTVPAERNLFPVDTSHHLSEGVQFQIDGLDMFNVVHLDLSLRATISARLFQGTNCGDISGLDGQRVTEESLP